MSYRDPYADPYSQRGQAQAPYGESYNPYLHGDNQGPHQTYDAYDAYAGRYRDEPAGSQPQPLNSGYSTRTGAMEQNGQGSKERSVFEKDEPFSPPSRRKSRSAATVRSWRYEHQGDNLWTAGGRGKCIGRVLCCSLMTFVFLVVSIILTLALWIRPPNVTIGNLNTVTNGSAIQLTSDGITLNLQTNISVNNPNFFNVAFNELKVELTYPINNTDIGGGKQSDITFDSHANKTFQFPFSLVYTTASDPNNAILADLATKCGFLGTPKTNIVVDYKLVLGLKVLFFTISPTVSNTFNFACPLKESDVAGLLKAAGMSGLGGLR